MSADIEIKWYDRRYIQKIGSEMDRRLGRAAEHLRGRIVRNISLPTAVHGPSRKGEYPHADTGKLRQSIFARSSGRGVAQVGSPLDYAEHLEKHGRSFILRTFNEEKPTLRRIMLTPIRG